MKKKEVLLIPLIVISMMLLTSCQDNYKVTIYRGAIKNSSDVYYDENYIMKDYEWNGTDLTIHFQEDK